MSRAIVYVRVSSQDQVNGFSLDVQERVCRDYAERQGWTVTTVYREEGESAKTTDRPELQRAFARLAGVSDFLVYDLTRLSRDVGDYVALKARLDFNRKSGFQTPAKSLYISSLTGNSQPSCEQWYRERCGPSTVALLIDGWTSLVPFVEDQCQTTP